MELLDFFTCMSRRRHRAIVATEEEEEIVVHAATQQQQQQQLDDHGDVDDVPDLPDDIIMDILSRLPADVVLRHRTVCKSWLSMTSSPYFAELHLRRASPSLLIQHVSVPVSSSNGLELFMFDEDKQAKRIRNGFVNLPEEAKLRLIGSYNGILIFVHMFTNGSRIEFCNIVTGEQYRIETPPETHHGMDLLPHAMFVHQEKEEEYRYRMLFTCQIGEWPDDIHYDYYVYSLSPNLTWRKVVSSFPYHPEPFCDPVFILVNTTLLLFWMTSRVQVSDRRSAPCERSIIMFDTVAETIRAMPHPVDTTTITTSCTSSQHLLMCVFESEGVLHFLTAASQVVGVWVLEDFDNWYWTKKQAIDLRETISYPPPSSSSTSWYWPWWPNSSSSSSKSVPLDLIKVVNVGGEKLLLHFPERLFLLNLKTNKIVLTLDQKNMDKSGLQLDGRFFDVFFYTKSFIPLT